MPVYDVIIVFRQSDRRFRDGGFWFGRLNNSIFDRRARTTPAAVIHVSCSANGAATVDVYVLWARVPLQQRVHVIPIYYTPFSTTAPTYVSTHHTCMYSKTDISVSVVRFYPYGVHGCNCYARIAYVPTSFRRSVYVTRGLVRRTQSHRQCTRRNE